MIGLKKIKKGEKFMSLNDRIIQSIIDKDETFIWEVTGSVRDIKFNPFYLILTILTLGIFAIALYYNRIYHSYVLTSQRLVVISGIFSKDVDEIELFRIVDSSASQTMIDVWADLGDIYINSTDKTGMLRMHKIREPHRVRDSLRKQYMAARQKKGTVILESINS